MSSLNILLLPCMCSILKTKESFSSLQEKKVKMKNEYSKQIFSSQFVKQPCKFPVLEATEQYQQDLYTTTEAAQGLIILYHNV